jgi:hypothetical protein
MLAKPLISKYLAMSDQIGRSLFAHPKNDESFERKSPMESIPHIEDAP